MRYVTGGTNPSAKDNTINCMGNTNTTQTLYSNVFSVATVAGVPSLVCSLNGAAVRCRWRAASRNSKSFTACKPIPPPSPIPRIHTSNAAAVNAGNYWGKILSVKIQLTFTNPMANQPGQLPTILFTRVVDVMNKTGVST